MNPYERKIEECARLRTALRGLVEAAKQMDIDYDTLCVYVNDSFIRWTTFQASIIKLQTAIAAAEAEERGEE